jgi:hypothetical protein
MRLTNNFPLLVIFLIGLFSDWGDAFWFLGGYLLALFIVSWEEGRKQRRL